MYKKIFRDYSIIKYNMQSCDLQQKINNAVKVFADAAIDLSGDLGYNCPVILEMPRGATEEDK